MPMALLLVNRRRMGPARGRREALAIAALAGAAVVAVLAFAHGAARAPASFADQGWTGQLATAAPVEAPPAEPLSSAALVVPKSRMALPPPPVLHVKAVCDSADTTCVTRAASAPPDASAAKRRVAALDPVVARDVAAKTKTDAKASGGFLGGLNPLAHLPDIASFGRPIASAGHAVANWITRF
jgi:hypothetical protein